MREEVVVTKLNLIVPAEAMKASDYAQHPEHWDQQLCCSL
jgi:hypothetical protein